MANYRGDIHISQGLNAGIERILDAMQGRKDEEKQRARMFKSLVEYADTSGIMSKDQAMTRSLDELDGIVKGTIAKQKFQEVTGLPKFYEALAQGVPRQGSSGGGGAQPDILSLIAGASRESGYAPPPENLDDIIRALSSQQQAPQLPMGGVLEVPGGGRLIGTGGQNAQFVPPQEPDGPASTMGKIIQDLQAAEAAGDEQGAAFLRAAAEKAATTMGMTWGQDDQGRPIMTMGPVGKQTTAQASKLQASVNKKEKIIGLIRQIRKRLRPEDVGMHGVIGETVFDTGLSQLTRALGKQPKINNERVQNRELLGLLRESALREISDDPRFSNADRESIAKLLPETGAWESFETAQEKLLILEQLMSSRAIQDSSEIGKSAPFAMTLDELWDAGTSGKMTPDEVQDALVKYHGYRKTIPPPQRATDITPPAPPRMENPSRGQMMRY